MRKNIGQAITGALKDQARRDYDRLRLPIGWLFPAGGGFLSYEQMRDHPLVTETWADYLTSR